MERFFRVKDSRIALSGIDRKYKILHISDCHICAVDSLSTEQDIQHSVSSELHWAKTKRDFARRFSEPFYHCHEISTVQAFEKVLDFCRFENPDLLILAGDILEDIHPAGLRLLQDKLSSLPFPYLYVLGNHEGGSPDNALLSKLAEGDSVQVRDFGSFRVLGIDNSQKTVSDKQLKELRGLLSEQIPTIVVMHIPLCTDFNREEMKIFGEYFLLDEETADKNGAELVRLIVESNSVIQLLCGHLHSTSASYIAENKPQFCSSSGMIGFIHRITVG